MLLAVGRLPLSVSAPRTSVIVALAAGEEVDAFVPRSRPKSDSNTITSHFNVYHAVCFLFILRIWFSVIQKKDFFILMTCLREAKFHGTVKRKCTELVRGSYNLYRLSTEIKNEGTDESRDKQTNLV